MVSRSIKSKALLEQNNGREQLRVPEETHLDTDYA